MPQSNHTLGPATRQRWRSLIVHKVLAEYMQKAGLGLGDKQLRPNVQWL
jgi:hypothetical protein